MNIEFMCWFAANVVRESKYKNLRDNLTRQENGLKPVCFDNTFLNVEVNFNNMFYSDYLEQTLMCYPVLDIAIPDRGENNEAAQAALGSAVVFLENAFKNKGPLKDMGYDEIVARLEDCVVAGKTVNDERSMFRETTLETYGSYYAKEALFVVKQA